MTLARMDRRSVLIGTGALAALEVGPGFTSLARALTEPAFDASTSFTSAHVQNLAEQLSTQPFAKPTITAPAFQKLGYDQFRDIRFRTDQAIWRGEKLDCELQLLPMGWLYDVPVEIWLVDGGNAKRLTADSACSRSGRSSATAAPARLTASPASACTGPSIAPNIWTSSWCSRARATSAPSARGQSYGLSARGLAINTARPQRRGVSDLPRVLDREADARALEHRRPRAARQPVRDRRLPLRDRGRRRRRISMSRRRSFRAARSRTSASRRSPACSSTVRDRAAIERLPPRRPRQRRPCHLERSGRAPLAAAHQPAACCRPAPSWTRIRRASASCSASAHFADYEDLEARYERRPDRSGSSRRANGATATSS